tara:strand:- start:168 stop:362 length:195 start_codon:yes stop_codon:yes gene_type:complete
MSKVSVEVAITKTYVIEGLQRNEVYDLVNDEHTQFLYLEDIKAGNLDDKYVKEDIRIVSTMEEE